MKKIRLLIALICLCIPVSGCSWLAKVGLNTLNKPSTSNSANLAIGDNKKLNTSNINNKKQSVAQNSGQNAGESITNANGQGTVIYQAYVPISYWLSFWSVSLLLVLSLVGGAMALVSYPPVWYSRWSKKRKDYFLKYKE